MKSVHKILMTTAILMIVMPAFLACKKGDGDPSLSLISRTNRLSKDWKVTSLNKTVSYDNTIITTRFSGSSKTVERYVFDTVWTDGISTFYTYTETRQYTGYIYYDFEKDGKYQVDEAFTDDDTDIKFTSLEKGFWYFTGGGDASGTKYKELLGLQTDEFVYNPLSPDTYTYTYSGTNAMEIFHIYALSGSDVELRYNTEETTNFYNIKTEMVIKLQLR